MASRKRKATSKANTARRAKTNSASGKSKQQRMIDMLRRPEGATIAQLGKAFGWQPHTVRGAISGALKKKLGLKVASRKPDGGELIYHIG